MTGLAYQLLRGVFGRIVTRQFEARVEGEASLDDRLAGSVPFCTMAAVAVAGWQMMKQDEAVAAGAAPSLAETKPVTVRFFLDRIVPEAAGLKAGATAGADLLYKLPSDALVG